MKHRGKYVAKKLIAEIWKRLMEKDRYGRRKYSVSDLKDNHLSGRAQAHFLNDPGALTVLQFYAAIRILLINAPSEWDRLLLLCHFLDMLEEGFAECFGDVTIPLFAGGVEKTVRKKLLSVAEYDFERVIEDVGKWRGRNRKTK